MGLTNALSIADFYRDNKKRLNEALILISGIRGIKADIGIILDKSNVCKIGITRFLNETQKCRVHAPLFSQPLYS